MGHFRRYGGFMEACRLICLPTGATMQQRVCVANELAIVNQNTSRSQ